jgi:hypothetical protein
LTNKVKVAVDPNELPEEERATFLQNLGEDFQPSIQEEGDGTDFFQNKSIDAMRYWSQFTNYSIPMDQGDSLKIYRVPATKKQINEIQDLSATIAAKYELTPKGQKKFLDPLELRRKEKELELLKINIYLRKEKGDQPPTMKELEHVADSTMIDGILESCVAVSMAKWHQGKK